MAYIIDQETGELIEEVNKNELVAKELEPIITEEFLDNYAKFEYYSQQLETFKNKNKEFIKQVFQKYNIKTCKNDYITISYVPEHMQQRVDVDRLKADGLYEKYTKYSNVKESIRVSMKGKND